MSKYKGAFQVVEPVEEELTQEIPDDYPEVDTLSETEVEDVPEGTPKGTPAEVRSLTLDVSELSLAVGELDAQLRQILRVNQALEEDLARSRKRVGYLTGERERLIVEIEDMEQEALSVEDMQAEVEQLHRERNTLAGKAQNLTRALATSEQRVLEIVQLLDRFRAERDGASQEAVCLDAQFSRAMKVIEELRTELDERKEHEEKLEARIKLLQKQLSAAVGQRDSFKVELAESRQALEEIRRSILDASRES